MSLQSVFRGDSFEQRPIYALDVALDWQSEHALTGPFLSRTGIGIGYASYTVRAADLRAKDDAVKNRDLMREHYWFGDLRFALAFATGADSDGEILQTTELGVGWRFNSYNPEVRRTAGDTIIPTEIVYPYVGLTTLL